MRRGLTQRALLASSLVGVVVVAEFAVLFLAFTSLRAEERQDNQAVNVLATSNALEESVLNVSTGLRIYLISGHPGQLRTYEAALARYPRQVRQLDQLTGGNAELHARVTSISDVHRGLRPALDRADHQAEPVEPARGPAGVGLQRGQAAGGGDPGPVRRAGPRPAESQHRAPGRGGAQHRPGPRVRRGRPGRRGASAPAWAIGLHRMVVRPVQRLAEATGRLRGGDLSARVPERGTGELGDLAAGFNAMAAGT